MCIHLIYTYEVDSLEELTHWKRLWCWEGLGAGGEGDNRGWDGWMASPTRCTWVWVNSGSWWWAGRPGVLWFMGSQRVRHNWATELNWTHIYYTYIYTHLIYIYFGGLDIKKCRNCISVIPEQFYQYEMYIDRYRCSYRHIMQINRKFWHVHRKKQLNNGKIYSVRSTKCEL